MRVVGRGSGPVALAAVAAAVVLLSPPAQSQSDAARDLVATFCAGAETVPAAELRAYLDDFRAEAEAAARAVEPLVIIVADARAALAAYERSLAERGRVVRDVANAQVIAIRTMAIGAEAEFEALVDAVKAGTRDAADLKVVQQRMQELRLAEASDNRELQQIDTTLQEGGRLLAALVGGLTDYDEKTRAVTAAEAALREAQAWSAAFYAAEQPVSDCVGEAIEDRAEVEPAPPPPVPTGPPVASGAIRNMQCNMELFDQTGSSSGVTGEFRFERTADTIAGRVSLNNGNLIIDAPGRIDESGYMTIGTELSVSELSGTFRATGTLHPDSGDPAVLRGNGYADLALSDVTPGEVNVSLSCTMEWETTPAD